MAMWRRLSVAHQQRRLLHLSTSQRQARDVILIRDATFYTNHPAETDTPVSNPPLFSNLSFSLPVKEAKGEDPQYWSVLSPSSAARTAFLQILAAQHIATPASARTYPYLSEISTSPQHAIKYVGFDAERGSSVGGTDVRGAYLSARYESRREETDYSLLDYLTGHTELNALEHQQSATEKLYLDQIVQRLNLRALLRMPVANLSNGQTRRARIAKALVARPEVLLLDGPFMGLDPNTLATMESVLHDIAQSQSPRVIMSLRPEDGIPGWISHVLVADDNLQVLAQGSKNVILNATQGTQALRSVVQGAKLGHASQTTAALSRDGWPRDSPAANPGEALVEMRGVKVTYGDKVVLGDFQQTIQGAEQPGLWWSLHRGQRCGIFGPNGSGKTTMLSLITSDHPQTYSLPIKLFGCSRLPGPGEAGISLFDIQKRMGHSSPEVHAFFPKQLTVRRAIESAWADAPLARAKLTSEADRRVNAVLRWFARELNPRHVEKTALEALEEDYDAQRGASPKCQLDATRQKYKETILNDSDLTWADDIRFRELNFSSQRLTLFLRALVAQPDLVILDEALSGIDEHVRDKALLFLSHGEKMAVVGNGSPRPSLLAKLDKVAFAGLSTEQALLVISHTKEDVPGCLREWICLPEPGEGRLPRTGSLSGPLELSPEGWNSIWGKGDGK